MNLFEMHYAEIAKRNKTDRQCQTCGNEIRKNDDKATERQCGFCASQRGVAADKEGGGR